MKKEVITKIEMSQPEIAVIVRAIGFMRENLVTDNGMYSINDKDGEKNTPFDEDEYLILKRIYFSFCED